MKTLEEIDQLEQSRFGQPHPRHGLKLLYWFANDCLSFDQNNVLQLSCYPKNGDFGFHTFENRYERNDGKLLPDVTFPYYVVGNLRKPGASNLPRYVREHYTSFRDNSNMDRIIVSINNKWFHTVYVTEHSDRSKFNKHATYHISKRLIMIIRGLTLEDFLLRTGYLRLQANLFSTIPVKAPTYFRNPQAPSPAPSTTSSSIPAITSSRSQDTCIEIDESPPILMNNNTQQQTNIAESQLNNYARDNTIQILRISSLQTPSQDDQTTPTFTPTITSSTNQDFDIESSPVSQMNSCVITDDAQTYPISIFDATRRCYCTIL